MWPPCHLCRAAEPDNANVCISYVLTSSSSIRQASELPFFIACFIVDIMIAPGANVDFVNKSCTGIVFARYAKAAGVTYGEHRRMRLNRSASSYSADAMATFARALRM